MTDSIRLLHVDDDPDVAEVTAEFLSREDDRIAPVVESSTDGGLDRLRRETFDCVISDYDMPGTNGLEFLRSVRDHDPDLPFILFTGKGSEEIASEAITAGVTDYLQKGTGTEQYTVLANRVTNAVEAYTARQRLERREREYRTLMERSPVPTVLFDDTGTLIYANPSAVEFTGLDDRDELEGADAMKHVHPEDREGSSDRIERVLSDREPVEAREYRIVRGDGDIKHARGTLVPATFEGEPVAQAVLVDITEYKDEGNG